MNSAWHYLMHPWFDTMNGNDNCPGENQTFANVVMDVARCYERHADFSRDCLQAC